MKSNNVPRFFTRFLTGQTTIDETTEAVATLVNNNNGCVFLLQQNQTLQLNGVSMNEPNCGILANSSLVQTNGGTVTAGSFGYAHSLQDNSTDFTKATPQQIQPVADPCPEIPGCAYYAANPPSTLSCTAFTSTGLATVSPGCYSSFRVNGGSLTMQPGPYVFHRRCPK